VRRSSGGSLNVADQLVLLPFSWERKRSAAVLLFEKRGEKEGRKLSPERTSALSASPKTISSSLKGEKKSSSSSAVAVSQRWGGGGDRKKRAAYRSRRRATSSGKNSPSSSSILTRKKEVPALLLHLERGKKKKRGTAIGAHFPLLRVSPGPREKSRRLLRVSFQRERTDYVHVLVLHGGRRRRKGEGVERSSLHLRRSGHLSKRSPTSS